MAIVKRIDSSIFPNTSLTIDYGYGTETMTLCSFESDIVDQKRTKIESKVLLDSTFWTQDTEEDEWECNLDEFNTCDIEDTY